MKTKALLFILIAFGMLFFNAIKVKAQWIAQTSGKTTSLCSVYFSNANTAYTVGDGDVATIIKTINGGTNWISQTSGTIKPLSSVFFTDVSTGCAVGYGGTILMTSNGGTSWIPKTSGTTSWLSSVYFTDANTGYAVGDNGTILKTINGGTNWIIQTSGTTNYLSSVYFINVNTGYAVGGNATILKTDNGGINWTPQKSGITYNYDVRSVYFTDVNTGYVVGLYGTIIKTIDGGTNWVSQTSGTSNSLYSVCFADVNTGYAVGDHGTILKTTNGGMNWITQTSGTSELLNSVYFINTNTGCAVGLKGTIIKTITGGWCTGIPGQPSGATSLCRPTSITQYTTLGASGAASYSWSLNPASAGTISGTGTTSSVTWSGTYNGNATVIVQGVKSGCTGETSSLNVSINNSIANPVSFSLSSPQNGVWASSIPLFQWGVSTGTLTYSLYIDGVLKKENITGSSYQMLPADAISSGMHTWYIVASNGCTTQSNETWSFRVDATQPTAFNLVSPADNLWTASLQPTLKWSASSDVNSGLAKYQLWIDGVLNRDNISDSATSATPTSTLSNGSHTWEIRAVDNVGNIRNSTQTWTLKVDNKPPVFSNAIIEKLYLSIKWYDEFRFYGQDRNGWTLFDNLKNIVLSAKPNQFTYSYFELISLEPGSYAFDGYALAGHGWYNGSLTIQNVLSGGTSGAVQVTGYGETVNFTVGVNGNGVFSPSAKPFEFKTISETIPNFIWTAATDAGIGLQKYQLFVDNNLIADNLIETSFTIKSPLSYGHHTWNVKAFDALGNNSPVYDMPFWVDNAKPNPFSLTTPTNNQTVNLPTPNLTWQAATDSTGGSGMCKYQLWINGVKNRDSIPISQTTVAPSSALAQGAYTWFIKAYDNVGNVRQSTQSWTFYVDWEPPTAFTLIEPLNNTTLAVSRPLFKWNPSSDIGSGLGKYELCISGQAPITILPTETSKPITFDLPNGNYTWYVKAYDVAGAFTSSNTNNLTINVPLPSQATTPVGINELSVNAANTDYTTTGATNATSYIWEITPSGAGAISGTGLTGTVDWNNTFTGTAQITVRGHNGAGDGIVSAPLTITIYPATVGGSVSGSGNICLGISTGTLTLSGHTGNIIRWQKRVNSGIWSDIVNTTTSYSETPATIGVWEYRAEIKNGVSTALFSGVATITVNDIPPAAGTITGNTIVCKGGSETYTAPAITGATSYIWTLPTGVTGTSSTNSINITIGTTAVSGSIKVKGHNSCGDGTESTIALTINDIPSASGQITGNATVYKGINETYNVSAITGATSYIWTLPTGVTGTSNTNSITVTLSSTAASGNIKVKGRNSCGDGTESSLAITVSDVASGVITGNTSVCKGGTETYTVSAIAGATSYIWTLPSGATGTSSTTTINVTFGTSAVSGNIKVKGHNSGGDGTESSLAIIVNDIPSAAVTITGNTIVCKGGSETYSVPVITGATSYIWTLPVGVTGSSTMNSINVNYGNSATSGNILVKGSNACGNGVSASSSITVISKPITPVIIVKFDSLISNAPNGNQWYDNGTLIPNATKVSYKPTKNSTYYSVVTLNNCSSDQSNTINFTTVGMAEEKDISIKIIPNPNDGSFTFLYKTASNESIKLIELYNSMGVKLKVLSTAIQGTDVNHQFNLQYLPQGVYSLAITTQNRTYALKFIIMK